MEFVTVRQLRGKAAEIWKRLAKKKEIVVTSNGKPIAILSPTSEATLEESLSALRAARAISAVESLQTKSAETGLEKLTLEDINKEIRVIRKARRAA